MKVASIVGARPQFIKAAVVSRVIRRTPGMDEVLVHTGQHYDENMSDIFFRQLDIPTPDYNLGVGSGTHGAQTGRMLEAIERVLLDERPDFVLVYGDTNSTLAGALAAAKVHIPIAHVEAGLRSFRRSMPEEINRVVADHVSDLLLAPTQAAVENLRHEGIPDGRIYLVGDVMYDAALYFGEKAERESNVLRRLGIEAKSYLLVTVHRAENTDDLSNLKAIFGGVMRVAQKLPVVLPMHPRTQDALRRSGLLDLVANTLIVTEPQGYLDMVMLEKHAVLIATDSGGVQKEAFFYRVPCVTLREETEWVELLALGWNRLVSPTTPEAVESGILSGLSIGQAEEAQPYGDGHAAERIVRVLTGR